MQFLNFLCFLLSLLYSHNTENCLQHAHSHSQGAIMCTTSNLSHAACHVPCSAEGQLSCLSEVAFIFSFIVSVSVSASRWHRSARKGPYVLRPVSQQSPQGCPRNSANICLVEHRSLSTLEGGMSAASFLHSSFLQAINAVMLWLVHRLKL